jgi:signal peptidase I
MEMLESSSPQTPLNGPRAARRRWWLAGLLTFLGLGLGQLYNGQPRRGLLLFASWWPIALAACGTLVWPVPFWVPVTLFALLLVLDIFAIGDAIAGARRAGSPFMLRPYNRWYVYFAVYAAIVLFGLGALRLMHLQAMTFYIPSGAMEPTVLIGDHLAVDMLSLRQRAPRRGEIIVFRSTENPRISVIKRVVALPGEQISIVNKRIYLNGTLVDDSAYAIHRDSHSFSRESPSLMAARDNFGPYTVPPGTFFCLGDNRDNSWDSRFTGPVPRSNIEGGGRIRVYWSRNLHAVRWHRIGSFLH